jgi:hypothetical protein
MQKNAAFHGFMTAQPVWLHGTEGRSELDFAFSNPRNKSNELEQTLALLYRFVNYPRAQMPQKSMAGLLVQG